MLLRRRMLKGLKSGNLKNLKASEGQRSPFAYTPVEEQAHAPRAEGEPARLLPEARPHEFRGLHPRGMIRFALRPGLQWEDRHSIMYYTHYGDSGTVTVGRYQNSGASTGTLDINILGHVGHTLPLPSSFSSSVPASQLCSYKKRPCHNNRICN